MPCISLRLTVVGLFVCITSGLHAQPQDWVVVPSAYEFSMTLTFTISIDGLVGAGEQNVAAIFDENGNCRGTGTTDFQANSGYFTGLMLVYGNQASESDLEVRIWDAALDSLPTCDNSVNFVANGIVGSLANPEVLYGVYDPLIGCTNPDACNYLATAITDNGSCIFPSCNDAMACNYVAASPCYDNNSCTYPELYLDCEGNCLNDFDGDGICDELEIGGCTDDRACNYDPVATDEDCSCEFPFYPLDCNGNCYIDLDDDGVCEADEIAGCDDPVGCNYDPIFTDNDGSCIYCCYSIYDDALGFSLNVERHAGLGTEQPGLTGLTTFRVYITCSHPQDQVLAVSGSGGNSTFIGSDNNFYQSASGGLLVTDIDSSAFANDIEVALDSWLTIGLDQPGATGELSPLSASTGLWSTLFELGESLFIGGVSGDGWSTDEASEASFAGDDLSVLLGQFTSATPIEGSLNVTVLPFGETEPVTITPLFVAPPCGCTDPISCNYDAASTYDDGSCQYANIGEDCNGNCTNDSDGDGICDGDEVAGCLDFNASNYNALATDDDNSCLYLGCTYLDATNYTLGSNSDDGSCLFDLSNPCPADINGDGITTAADILSILAAYGLPCQQ